MYRNKYRNTDEHADPFVLLSSKFRAVTRLRALLKPTTDSVATTWHTSSARIQDGIRETRLDSGQKHGRINDNHSRRGINPREE
ncbi:hypothetical protein E4U54_002212 [Claviceps lovelessii]|nr:hypothetical protein E4U54_002212 [Claviceps lovelessii]